MKKEKKRKIRDIILQACESAARVKKMADIIIPIHDPVMTKKKQIS